MDAGGRGINNYLTIFLPWWSRPGRTPEWYAAQLQEYDDPALVKQEYPSSVIEAFLVSGRVRFLQAWIEAQAANVRPGLPRELWPQQGGHAGQTGQPEGRHGGRPLREIDGLTIYALPQRGRRYVLGADVAEGLEHGDYSAAVLIDCETWEEVACLRGHWESDEYAAHLWALARAYGGERGVEARRVYRGSDGRPGWVTNAQSKPYAVGLLAKALRDGLVKVRSAVALNAMHIYRVGPNGATGAPAGYFDDLVMAWCIALGIAAQSLELQSGSVDWHATAAVALPAIAPGRTDDEIEAMLAAAESEA